MKKLTIILAALVALATAPALALDANVRVIHGINGTDLGFDEALPVDVFVSGVGCALTGFEFRTVTDPIALPAGKYDIEVRVSDGSCTGPLATSTTVDLAVVENATIIAHLNEEGSATLTKYSDDLRAIAEDDTRLSVRHAAAAPPVAFLAQHRFRQIVLWNLDNPEGRSDDLKAGTYKASIFDDSNGLFGARLVGPIPLELPESTAVTVYAIGSLANGTFELLPVATLIE